jgi:hypothetical protein
LDANGFIGKLFGAGGRYVPPPVSLVFDYPFPPREVV